LSGGDFSVWALEEGSLGEKRLRIVGAWPSDDPYEALLALLDRSIAATEDPREKVEADGPQEQRDRCRQAADRGPGSAIF